MEQAERTAPSEDRGIFLRPQRLFFFPPEEPDEERDPEEDRDDPLRDGAAGEDRPDCLDPEIRLPERGAVARSPPLLEGGVRRTPDCASVRYRLREE